jgi:hypothetical protein
MTLLHECEMRTETWLALIDEKLPEVRWRKKIKIILWLFI